MASTRCNNKFLNACGQSSIEYVLLLLAFLSTIVAFCALWGVSRRGPLSEYVVRHLSHSLGQGLTVELMQDVTAY